MRITNLLFRIFMNTNQLDSFLQRVVRIGTVMLSAGGGCFYMVDKRSGQLVMSGGSGKTLATGIPLTGNELVDVCNQDGNRWARYGNHILIPLYVNDTVQAMICFFDAARPPGGDMTAAADRILDMLGKLYEQKTTTLMKELYHKALIDISQVITQSDDFDDVITTSMRMASEVTGGSCAIMLLTKDEQYLIPSYAHNIEMSDYNNIPMIPQMGLDQTSYEAIRERKAVIVEDVPADPRADQEFCKKYGIRSYLTMPLIFLDRPIGVMFVDYIYKHRFTDMELRFFYDLGHQISHVITTLKTQLELLETKHIQDRLIEMMREMTNTTRLKDVLDDMVSKTHDLLEEKVGVSVWLINETSDRIVLSTWRGDKVNLLQTESVTFSLEELGNAAVLQDLFLEVDSHSTIGQFFLRSGAFYSMGTPLMAGKDLIGILFLHAYDGHQWTDREKLTLSTIGIHAGPIIRNTQYIQLLEKESKLDGLTKVFNRHHFEKTFRDYSRQHVESNKPFSLLMVDIDNFKQINDRYGHTVGDRVVKNVASLLQETTRRGDMVFRYGGEEFCLFLPYTSKVQAEQVAERIRVTIAEADVEPRVTVSIGVATFPECSKDPRLVLEMADHALYKAKRNGKNCVISAD